jgi:hypothetical protein
LWIVARSPKCGIKPWHGFLLPSHSLSLFSVSICPWRLPAWMSVSATWWVGHQ